MFWQKKIIITPTVITSTFSPIETKAVIAANAQHRRQSTSATRDQITWSLDTHVVTSWSEVNASQWNSGRHRDAYCKTRPHQVERYWQLCVCRWFMPVFPHSRRCNAVYSQSLLSSFFLLLQNPVLAELGTLLVSPSLPGGKKQKQVYRITFRKKNRKTFVSTTTHTKPGLQDNL